MVQPNDQQQQIKKSHNVVIRVKAFVIMSDDLSLILVTPTVEGES